jgi:immunity protein 27 of polymorphic toxin system
LNKLQPNERVLTGRWLVEDGRARGDAICDRIECLAVHHLQKVAISPDSGGWETLYRDPDDGRYWERTYPQSEMHGGGPPELKCLTFQEASKKYGAAVLAPQ